jgi:hypothetical protein
LHASGRKSGDLMRSPFAIRNLEFVMTGRPSRLLRNLFVSIGILTVLVAAPSARPQRPRQGPSVGVAVLRDPDRFHPSPVYYLVAPLDSTTTYLVDNQLRVVHEWASESTPGLSAYLLDRGRLLRTAHPAPTSFDSAGGIGGRVELFGWHGELLWRVDYASDRVQQHHDAILLPNGHVLMIAFETHTIAEALDAGRRPENLPDGPEMWSDTLVEIDPETGEVTWKWRMWDHLVPPGQRPSDHPELVDPNAAPSKKPDWTHVNAVAYNAALDQVLISSRHFSEIMIIDHGTTMDEAQGHTGGRRGRGGDLLYRWGHPTLYGAPGGQILIGQHNAQWIPDGFAGAGHILLFDNGDAARPWSRAVELVTPMRDDGLYTLELGSAYEPAAPAWEYVADPPASVFGSYASGVQRLADGNTLLAVTETGRFRVVDPEGRVLSDYQLAIEGVPLRMFRVSAYSSSDRVLASWRLEPTGATLGTVLSTAATASSDADTSRRTSRVAGVVPR